MIKAYLKIDKTKETVSAQFWTDECNCVDCRKPNCYVFDKGFITPIKELKSCLQPMLNDYADNYLDIWLDRPYTKAPIVEPNEEYFSELLAEHEIKVPSTLQYEVFSYDNYAYKVADVILCNQIDKDVYNALYDGNYGNLVTLSMDKLIRIGIENNNLSESIKSSGELKEWIDWLDEVKDTVEHYKQVALGYFNLIIRNRDLCDYWKYLTDKRYY